MPQDPPQPAPRNERQAAGRFAPSPTGPLHAGSLLAATASYLDARSRGDSWLLRIDDLDHFRIIEGAESAILRSLEAHGLQWDGPVLRQSERIPAYEAALAQLGEDDRLFYCNCSRKALRELPIYPGTCRSQRRPREDCALRVRVDDAEIAFTDLIVGPQQERLGEAVGDFIVRRRDGLIAYQLATAVDDGEASISRVIRGGDLLDNTARQIFLMEALQLTVPSYGHLATLVYPDGAKLSKQSHAPGLDDASASANLADTLRRLGLNPPAGLSGAEPAELLSWATGVFDLSALSAVDVIYRH